MVENKLIPTKDFSEIKRIRPNPIDDETISKAKDIVDAVKSGGLKTLREYALGFGDIEPDSAVILDRPQLAESLNRISSSDREVLERTANQITTFALAQKECFRDLSLSTPAGSMGHNIVPVKIAGCYAPGGRYPLPSSVLMTVCTAKAAGVSQIIAASPKPQDIIKAAAYIAGADSFLTCGGAQAIAALAYGTEVNPACDKIVGPGSRWVTAAKYLVSKDVGIEMLAGPSELVIICDDSADPAVLAADLLAQAEHDVDAQPILLSLSKDLITLVRAELTRQLETLPTAKIAKESLTRSFSILASSFDEATEIVNFLAPEHLELDIRDPESILPKIQNYGAVFIGQNSAEVFCDYGLGPNHVLPTSRFARFRGGLSVLDFLKINTWLKVDDISACAHFAADTAQLARLEGLEAHARSAEARYKG